MSLLDKRVVLVTGKGGVGKTSVSVAIALEAARRGQRVLLAEMSGATRVPAIWGVKGRGYEVSPLERGVETLSIDSDAAIEDYIIQQIRIRALYKLVFRNRVMGPFLDAVPGLHDVVQLGKVFDMERATRRGRPSWDLIVVDAPATGHGLTMLSAPGSMMDLTVTGPFHENARVVHELFVDPKRTGLVLVTLPEEMPVNETLDLYERLGEYRPLLSGLVLNEMHPELLPDAERWPAVRPAFEGLGVDEALRFTDRAAHRARQQAEARERLAPLPCPRVELPYLFKRDLSPEELGAQGQRLGPLLDGGR
ncbi:MAG: ArsA family ATPase [Alphaproteobacteria bacterium]|nr:ArsA family ATPase [Alphaproteobacteria bacterium]